MSAIYDYQGVVKKVLEKQTFASGFYKQDIILTDDVDAMSKYPALIPISFKKDNCAKIANLKEGQRVKVRFAIDGREWQGRYFTDLTGLNVEVVNGDGTSTEAIPEPPPPPEAPVADAAADADDLPF